MLVVRFADPENDTFVDGVRFVGVHDRIVDFSRPDNEKVARPHIVLAAADGILDIAIHEKIKFIVVMKMGKDGFI